MTINAASPCRLTADLAGYDVECDAAASSFYPSASSIQRVVTEIEFRVVPSTETLPDLDRRQRVGADEVRYTLSSQGSGSGGDDNTMRAERTLGTRILRQEWRGQAEDGLEPDFTDAWALMASADCKA